MAQSLRRLATDIQALASSSSSFSVAAPVISNCADHLCAIARVHELNNSILTADERLTTALENIALLDEADGHELTVEEAKKAVAIATRALGKHPSQIFAERHIRYRRRDDLKAFYLGPAIDGPLQGQKIICSRTTYSIPLLTKLSFGDKDATSPSEIKEVRYKWRDDLQGWSCEEPK